MDRYYGTQEAVYTKNAVGGSDGFTGWTLGIGGDADWDAMLQLRSLYLQQVEQTNCETLAIGDSGNDISMLEQASSALIIKSRNHCPRN